MDEGGVKAWEPLQAHNPLAFSDEEEEDLLDFMYKYKAPKRMDPPLEVPASGAAGWRVCLPRRFALETWAPQQWPLGIPSTPWCWGDKISLQQTGRTHLGAKAGAVGDREEARGLVSLDTSRS